MPLLKQLAKHFSDVHFGGNWTAVNLKEVLADVTWQQATTKVDDLNTIAALVFHMNYYVSAVLNVLQGNSLNARDKFSFDLLPIHSEQDWKMLLEKTWSEAGDFAALVEQLPEHQLWKTFADEKYGNYYRNIHGVIEHVHYHLGQIVLIKKRLQKESPVMDQ